MDTPYLNEYRYYVTGDVGNRTLKAVYCCTKYARVSEEKDKGKIVYYCYDHSSVVKRFALASKWN